MREMRTIFKRALSLLLAFIMIFGGLTTAFKINVVKAAGEELVQIPGTGKLTLKDNFDLFYKNMDFPDKVTEGTISESKDGSDNVTLILRKNFVGGIVSKEKFNMLRNDFEYIGSITMVNGTNPAVRGMAFAFHNDPRGRQALGGENEANGIHGSYYEHWGDHNSTELQNSVAIEVDPMNNGGTIDYEITDPVRDGRDGTGHIVIVKPMPKGQNVVHEAVS